jgi:tetratricopeptide (TPR) repeat protein
VPLREDHRKIAAAPLTLTASRKGEELAFQVNDTDPVVFRDWPLGGNKAWTFDLTWPRGVRLLRLHVRQASTPTGSSLEQGDDLYARGQYRQALTDYLEQARKAGATTEGQRLRRQALCKAGFCRLRLNQLTEATRHFEQVASDETTDPGERWALMARYQLWFLLVRDKQFDGTEGLFHKIRDDDPDFKESASLIPDRMRKQIAYAYFNTIGDLADPKIVQRRELCVDVCDYLQAASDRAPARIALLRAYWWFGQDECALQTAEQTQKLCEPYSETPGNLLAEMLRHYCWLLRRRREAGRALDEVQQGLNRPGGLYQSLTVVAAGSVGGAGAPPGQRPLLAASALVAGMAACRSGWFSADLTLLLERCRVHAALSRWDQAEADLEEFFRLGPTDLVPYRIFCQACLMQGFLHERRGDRPGAVRAWRRGLFPNWAPHLDAETRQHQFADLTERFHHLMLASLSNELGDADVQLLWEKDVPRIFVPYLKQLVPTSVFRVMCRTPRGREAARRYAFLELSLPEHGRLPISILVAEFFHQGAVPGELSGEQEELLWQTAERCVLDATTKKLSRVQMLQLLFAFQGDKDLPRSLEPSLRGSLAYILGQRYLRVLNKPAKEVVALFRTAWKDAPPDSPLCRLAQAELDRLQRR